MTVVETNKIGSLQGCMDFKQREEAHDDEDITVKSIATAFQFGVALGFAKKYDEMDKVIEEVKKAITPTQKTGHWIDKSRGEQKNSECSECHTLFRVLIHDYPYCPCCGSRNRGDEE